MQCGQLVRSQRYSHIGVGGYLVVGCLCALLASTIGTPMI